jgi:hypothetical protein
MLTITTRCDCPACDGAVQFTFEPSVRKPQHRFGSCDACGATYSLYGGQIRSSAERQPPGPDLDHPSVGSMPQRLAS